MAHPAGNIDTVNDLTLSQECASGTQKTIRQIDRETDILQRSVGRIIHRHSVKVPEETILAQSRIQHSITDQADNQLRNRLNACVKVKGKHCIHLRRCVCLQLSICHDV